MTPISSSHASKDIVHPSHKTSNMDPSPSKSVSIETSNGGKKETIILPRLEKMENSIITINSTTGDAELDTLARISNTSGKTPGYKGAIPSKVSHELNHESSPIDSNHLNDTDHPTLHDTQALPLSNEQTGKNCCSRVDLEFISLFYQKFDYCVWGGWLCPGVAGHPWLTIDWSY